MLIRVYPTKLIVDDTTYILRICCEERPAGTWIGWLEFHSTDATKPAMLIEQETSQPNRTALEYWEDGLEPVYLKAHSPERRDGCSSRCSFCADGA